MHDYARLYENIPDYAICTAYLAILVADFAILVACWPYLWLVGHTCGIFGGLLAILVAYLAIFGGIFGHTCGIFGGLLAILVAYLAIFGGLLAILTAYSPILSALVFTRRSRQDG